MIKNYLEINDEIKIIVDDEDVEKILQHKWHLQNGYVYSSKVGTLHRFILNMPRKKMFLQVDHINGNKLDNRKINLRPVFSFQNQQNKKSSKEFKGIHKNNTSKQDRWSAIICYRGDSIYIGTYTNKYKAAKAYDIYAKKLFGEYAKLNFDMRPAL